MNYQHQYLQILLQKWKAKLDIKRLVTVFTDPDEYLEIFPQDKKNILEAGLCQRQYGLIYINLNIRDHKLFTELEDTLVHELLHLKFPDKTEKEIMEMTEKYLELP